MPVPPGTEAYNADVPPVLARGYSYDGAALDVARSTRIPEVLGDTPGRTSLAELFGGLELTEFGSENVAEALQGLPEEEHSKGWREGEALAEAWLADHRSCEFPWPFNRDVRHPRASLPGPELVGFTDDPSGDVRFAFGQVKTSKEDKYPPQVIYNGDKSLINQMLQLRDDKAIKKTIIEYLAYRSNGSSWSNKFRKAAVRYFNSGMTEISLFGVLIRDVEPRDADLKRAATALREECHASTSIEFCGLYLPLGSIPEGPSHRARSQNRASK